MPSHLLSVTNPFLVAFPGSADSLTLTDETLEGRLASLVTLFVDPDVTTPHDRIAGIHQLPPQALLLCAPHFLPDLRPFSCFSSSDARGTLLFPMVTTGVAGGIR